MESVWIIFFMLFVVFAEQKRQNILITVRRHLRAKRSKFDMTEMIKAKSV